MPTFNYTLTLSDAWSVVDINIGPASTLTVPPNSSVAFPVGTVVWVTKRTGNTLTIVAGSGVTVNAVDGNLTTSVGAGLVLALVKVAADTWNVGLIPGSAATKNVGTTAGTVAAGDDSRLSDTRTPTDNSVTSAKIVDGAIVNADINASAAIDFSKLAAPAADFSMNSHKLTSLANGTAATDAAALGQLGAWLIVIPPFATGYTVVAGTWSGANTTSALQPFNNNLLNTSNTQNDEVNWPVWLAAGTWTISVFRRKDTDEGIITFKIGSTSVGTVDGYAASTAWAEQTVTGVSVASSGYTTFGIKMATKNASSSGYKVGQLNLITLTRTA